MVAVAVPRYHVYRQAACREKVGVDQVVEFALERLTTTAGRIRLAERARAIRNRKSSIVSGFRRSACILAVSRFSSTSRRQRMLFGTPRR
jgi:hypothetical protein